MPELRSQYLHNPQDAEDAFVQGLVTELVETPLLNQAPSPHPLDRLLDRQKAFEEKIQKQMSLILERLEALEVNARPSSP